MNKDRAWTAFYLQVMHHEICELMIDHLVQQLKLHKQQTIRSRLDVGCGEQNTNSKCLSSRGLKINSPCVCNQCWRGHLLGGGTGPSLSLSILSQQMLFLIPSESQDTLTYPLDPLLSSSLCAYCVIRQLTSYVFFSSFLSYLFSLKVHQLKIVFIFVP